MKVSREQVSYTAQLDDVTEPLTNRWGEEFIPDRLEAYWTKDAHGFWVIEVVSVLGPGVLKRTGELGTRRRSEWYDEREFNVGTEIDGRKRYHSKLPQELRILVMVNFPVTRG